MKGLPEQGQQVFVIAPSGAGIAARVRESEAQHSLLAFEDNESNPVSMLAGGNVAIQYTNRRGVCRIDGAARAGGGITLLRVEHTSKVQLIQRREFVRLDAILPVTYQPIGASGWTAETTTINISGGGFMISGREGLRIGDVCEFRVMLDGAWRESGELVTLGKVVREMPGGLGIELVDLDEKERERLIRWVFARERHGMQIMRGAI